MCALSYRLGTLLLALLLVSTAPSIAQTPRGESAAPAERHGKNKNRNGQDNGKPSSFPQESFYGNTILGCPTADSIVVNIMAPKGTRTWITYSTRSGQYDLKSQEYTAADDPLYIKLNGLQKNTRYYYRVHYGDMTSQEHSFITARNAGETFTFGVQGDSYPERAGKMFNSDLYRINMGNVAQERPDFYIALGDDFSMDKLIEQNQVTRATVEQVYRDHRTYFGILGPDTPLFLVNGNHEQAARYLLNGKPDSPAVLAANARNKYYSLPAPGGFYTGDNEKIEYVGYVLDYYSFEWGDALFVVLDPYWHSDQAVDNIPSSAGKNKDLWQNTLGKTQYNWFKQTLESSTAKYKFVFTHHVLGTGRGGIECAELDEWGGKNKRGQWEFPSRRPGWELPIHQLMVKNGVTIFFQGHDHLFAREMLDGVMYQSVPNPADNTYTAFNKDAYTGMVR